MFSIQTMTVRRVRVLAGVVAAVGVWALMGSANPNQGNGLRAAGAVAPQSRGVVLAQTQANGASRLVLVEWGGQVKELTAGFASATEPDVSFDGKRVVFAGKKTTGDQFQIYEVSLDGGAPRQVTKCQADCRQPVYQSRIFSLDIPEPWFQVAYVTNGALKSAKLDGTEEQQLTYTPAAVKDAAMTAEGRMVFSSGGRLFGINIDGTDYALFTPGGAGAQTQPAPVGRQVVFVEGAGQLAAVSLDRPMQSKRLVAAGLTAPTALNGDEVLAIKGGAELVRVKLAGGAPELVYSDAHWKLTAARVAGAHVEPDGRGTVVDVAYPASKLYCQSVYTTDAPKLLAPGTAKRLRVTAGTPAQPKKLGEFDLAADGSFHVQLPANTMVKLDVIGAQGRVLRSSAWIYARNKENRGCIGCHEDAELSPENREALAVIQKAINLMPDKSIPAGAEKH